MKKNRKECRSFGFAMLSMLNVSAIKESKQFLSEASVVDKSIARLDVEAGCIRG